MFANKIHEREIEIQQKLVKRVKKNIKLVDFLGLFTVKHTQVYNHCYATK